MTATPAATVQPVFLRQRQGFDVYDRVILTIAPASPGAQ